MKRVVHWLPITKYMLKRYEPTTNEENGLWDVGEEMGKEDKAWFRCWCCVVLFGDSVLIFEEYAYSTKAFIMVVHVRVWIYHSVSYQGFVYWNHI